MWKIILISIFLTSCVNLTFDNTEFNRLVTMKIISDEAAKECGDHKVLSSIKKLTRLNNQQQVYSQYRTSRPQIMIASTQISNMIQELQNRYNGHVPSTMYCQNKLNNISTGLDKMLQTLGTMK